MNKKELKRQHAIDFILLIPHPLFHPSSLFTVRTHYSGSHLSAYK